MTAAALADLAATAIAAVAMITLHVLPTGLSPWHNAVSQYGIGRYRLGYRVLTVALGVAGAAAAARVGALGARRGVVLALVVFAVSRLVISWVPMDAPGSPRTPRGTAHVGLAVLAFAGAALAAARLRPDGAAFTVAAALFVIGFLGMFADRRWFGLAERVVYLAIFVLLVAVPFVTG